MVILSYINYGLALFFTIFYSYHLFYLVISLVRRTKQFEPAAPHRYAFVIPARNEASVIGQLILSIKQQEYPAEMMDIYVVADNCSDRTAEIARQAGAIVWERYDEHHIGKGYALNFLFSRIKEITITYDGYIIVDADNILEKNYLCEMNKAFAAGHRIITSYRNSKNYGSNWISAGYSLWFLREAKFLNNARMILGTSCAISGTGFLVHREIIEKNEGWKHYLLTEDIEFTVDSILEGERIAYCSSAILYDEQPTELDQAWKQRLRWAKGILQVFGAYGRRLFEGFINTGNFSLYDMLMTIFPVIILGLVGFTINLSAVIILAFTSSEQLFKLLRSIWIALSNGYVFLFLIGLLTLSTEWKHIHCAVGKKLLYSFSFPVFMMTFIPISIVALFKRVGWDEIHHRIDKIQ